MRRLVLLALTLALLVPVAAWASPRSGDGTLVVDNGNGNVTVRIRGGILGRVQNTGNMVITDLDPTDGKVPVVYGAEARRTLGPGRTAYSGDNIRFRMIGGLYRVQIEGIGIDLSVVGRGSALLDASGFTDFPGRYSIDGGAFQPLPGHPTTFNLGQVAPGPPNVK